MTKEWLQLLLGKGVSGSAKRVLVSVLGSPGAVLRAGSGRIAEVLRANLDGGDGDDYDDDSWSRIVYPEVDSDLASLARIGGDFIGFTDADFPPLLNEIPAPPLGLFVLGDRALLRTPQLAIVGSRKPTPSGLRTTQKFAAELGACGLTITSGLAVGIDHCAHRGCLDAGGKTIAATATGIDVVYPPANRELHREIAENGLIVTEYPPGTAPRREHFPSRNRIISGLALGTLVVEAALQSGSLITARTAAEQGREVFAVPGSIHVAVSRGCHYLLRQGAKLTESTDDILEEIGQYFTPKIDPLTEASGGGKSATKSTKRATKKSAVKSAAKSGIKTAKSAAKSGVKIKCKINRKIRYKIRRQTNRKTNWGTCTIV